MKLLRNRVLAVAIIVLSPLLSWTGAHGSGSEGAPDASIRPLPTVLQARNYLMNSEDETTVAKFSLWAGSKPIPIRPGFYHWKLADGKLLGVTSKTAAGEVITCFMRTK